MGLFSAAVWSLCCKVSLEYVDLHRSEGAGSFLTEEEGFLMSFDPSVLGHTDWSLEAKAKRSVPKQRLTCKSAGNQGCDSLCTSAL